MFADRADAGKKLAQNLSAFKKDKPVIVALPRGGVVVGYVVAKILGAPLEVLIVRKIGSPYNAEFGIGAVAEDGTVFFDTGSVRRVGLKQKDLQAAKAKELSEIRRRKKLYAEAERADLKNKTIILIDDGIATGGTIQVAIKSLKKQNVKKIIVAVPLASEEIADRLRKEVGEFIALFEAPDLQAVGSFFDDFTQVTDEQVMTLLKAQKGRS
ncbi:MAG TPA: phosphoribosyltransferase family protein [Candidatus Saccharimonadales bacterium]|nr:phosphoribosyltransferase family protein [Candidatus Saccharimonadales bacterium]